MTKKILVLGGSGYLGSAIIDRFMHEEIYEITAGDLIKPVKPNHKFIYCDVLDKSQLESCVSKFDLIINCTGQIASPFSVCFDLNTQGIGNIADTVAKHKKKLLHISTVAIYGTCKYADEMTPINPESSYAACKAFAEYKIRSVLTTSSYCILRLSNLYGENQQKGVFAYLLKAYNTGEHLHFNQDGTLKRYFLNINDCANAILLAVEKNLCGVYNAASFERYNIFEIISLIEQISGFKFSAEFDGVKPIENIDELNIDSFISAAGFKPQSTIPEFIKKTFSKNAH